jgi:hypothetical protein
LVPTPLAPLSAAILVTMASLFPVALASASNLKNPCGLGKLTASGRVVTMG